MRSVSSIMLVQFINIVVLCLLLNVNVGTVFLCYDVGRNAKHIFIREDRNSGLNSIIFEYELFHKILCVLHETKTFYFIVKTVTIKLSIQNKKRILFAALLLPCAIGN